jgi:hypothetical protein
MRRLTQAFIITSLALVCAFAWWHHSGYDQWQPRQYYPHPPSDGCALLDQTLGSHARDRLALLEVLRWRYRQDGPNPHGLALSRFCDVQHEALLRLMALQSDQIPSAPVPSTLIDHTFIQIQSESPDRVVVLGTPSLLPDYYGRPWEGYWRMELLTFTREGRLLSRAAYRE